MKVAGRILSIITINYNNCTGLRQTLNTIDKQTFKDFELIVIDGGSTDGSVEVMNKFSDQIDYQVSEKDSGIYNAMNKGIAKASGEYVFFLNSGDDLYNEDVLKNIIHDLHTEDIIYANLLIQEKNKRWEKQYPSKLHFRYFIYDSLPHSGGIFIKRNCFRGELDHYDEKVEITADWKWFLTAIYKHNYSYKHLNILTGIFDYTGISATNSELLKKEKKIVLTTDFKEIYEEIMPLYKYKVKYNALMSSKFISTYIRLRNLIRR